MLVHSSQTETTLAPPAASTASAAPSAASASPSDAFRRFAVWASSALGTHWAFLAALLLVVGWAATGPLFHFGEQWQLVINTGTTIITFLMVFIIQTTQNRDGRAIQLKLDELIRSSKARNVFADLEHATDQELDAFQREFSSLRQQGVEAGSAFARAHRVARKQPLSAEPQPAK